MRLVDRALNALDILSRNMDGMSVTELANQLGIPASSTHRVLASLKGNDLVVQDKHTKKYHPSYRICGIAANIIKSSTLVRNGNPLVKELAEKINQKVDLCVMEHGAIRNIVSSNCGAPVQYMEQSELEQPECAMAAGQVFRAYQYMEPDMKEMEHIRRQGYTLVDCEEQSYKQEAACPIFDFYGDIMAALTFVSIKDGNTRELVRRICLLRQFAEQISKSVRQR